MLERVNLSGEMAGLDCEWRPTIIKYTTTKVSIFQIAFADRIYLLDMLALNTSERLNQKLAEFLPSNTIKLGVGF